MGTPSRKERTCDVSTHHCIWVGCDTCVPNPASLFTGHHQFVRADSEDTARIVLAKDGWRVIEGLDVCPDCQRFCPEAIERLVELSARRVAS